jgi:hypothetical protein
MAVKAKAYNIETNGGFSQECRAAAIRCEYQSPHFHSTRARQKRSFPAAEGPKRIVKKTKKKTTTTNLKNHKNYLGIHRDAFGYRRRRFMDI